MVEPTVDAFVGRATELRLVRQLLQIVTGGVGRLVLISGEPGIGKSRFAGEACALARDESFAVRTAACVEGAVVPPLWPWWQLLGREPQMSIGGGPPSDLYRFYSSMLLPTIEQSRKAPVFLVIDDLQWADADSLRLLQFAAHVLARERVLIVCVYCSSYRETSPVFGRVLGSLVKEPSTVAVRLPALDHSAIEQYCRNCGIREPEQIELAACLTDGVPLYLKAVSQWDGERRTLDRLSENRGESIATPAELRHVLDYRLSGLSSKSRDILETAALLGEEVDLDTLSAVSGLPREAVFDSLAEAARGDVVAISNGDFGRTVVRFVHALVRHAVVDTIAIAARLSRHARIYEALVHHYGEGRSARANELLHHAHRSGGLVDRVEIAELACTAGNAALRAGAPDEAARFFQLGLDELSNNGATAKEIAAGLHEGLASALYLMAPENTDIEGDEHCRKAMRLYTDLEDRTAIRRLLPLACRHPFRAAESHVAERLLELYSGHGAERGLVLLYAAVARYGETRLPEPALAILRPLLSKEHGGTEIRARAHCFLGSVYHWDGQYEEQLTHLESAIADAQEIGERSLELNCRQHAANLRNRLGRSEGGLPTDPESRIASAGSDGDNLETELDRRWRAFKGLGSLVLSCRWTEVLAALETARIPNPAEETTFVRAGAATTYSLTGRFEEARSVIDRLFESRRYFAPLWALNSSLDYWLSSGDLWYAERILKLCAQLRASPPYDRRTGAFARGHAALYCALLGRLGEAHQRFDAKDVPLLDGGSLVLGIAARYLDRIDLSVELLDPEGGLRAPPYHIGFRRLHCGLSLVKRNGDRDRARTLLCDALADAECYAIPPLASQARRGLYTLDPAPTDRRSSRQPATLTPREREVLALVAAGQSDKEIGWELSIGPKTVSNYVSKLLRKSRCGNRTELARWALDHRLAE